MVEDIKEVLMLDLVDQVVVVVPVTLLLVLVVLVQDLEQEMPVVMVEDSHLMLVVVEVVVPVAAGQAGSQSPQYAGYGGFGIQAPPTFRPATTGNSGGSPHGPSPNGGMVWFAGGGGGRDTSRNSKRCWRWTRMVQINQIILDGAGAGTGSNGPHASDGYTGTGSGGGGGGSSHLNLQVELVVDMVDMELLSSHTQPDKYLKT